jgi:uncharacterized protein YukE
MPKTAEEMAQEVNQNIESLKSQLSEALNKNDFNAFKTTVDEFLNKNKELDFNTLKTQLEDISEQIAQVKENMLGGQKGQSFESVVKNWISEKHEDIKNVLKAKHGVVELEISKEVANVTTGSATPQGTVPTYAHQQFAPAQNANIREGSILNLVTTLQTSLAAYPYTETVPKDGDYTFVAESIAKPQIDLKIETRYATPVKAAAWMRLTDESVTDIVGLQSIATDFLFKKHNRAKAKGILNGDGISPNPKGATRYGRVFVAGDMAGQVANPNIMDVINAAVTDIYTTHNFEDEMNYMANIAMMNPIDFFLNFVSAKTTEGLPLYPTAGLFNMVVIGGVMIVPDEDIASGKIFVADLTKYNVTNYVPYSVQIGWINDDFIKNQFVILGESRFHAFVKRLDEQAFIYDDIATIKEALAPAEPSV